MTKTVKKIELPLVAGQPAVIVMENGDRCQTHPKKIDSVICMDGAVEVTFTTINSIYKGFVLISSPVPTYRIGQSIKKGDKVISINNTEEIVDDIVDVTQDGITIRTKSGLFKGRIGLE
jgi:hypothetical protein